MHIVREGEPIQNLILISITCIAAGMDLIHFKVKNWLIIIGALTGILLQMISSGLEGVVISMAGITVPIICLGIFFLLHLFGAGDIKLFCVIGSFLGPIKVLYCIGAAILIGGVFGAIKLVFYEKEKDANEVKIRFAIPIFLSLLLYQGGVY